MQTGNTSLNTMAASATLHCLTGCAIGEISGMIIGTAFGLTNFITVAISITLAFIFGYSLSLLPLLQAQVGLFTAMRLVLVADTLSITTMELVDNFVMLAIPGAMAAGLVNPVFWLAMPFSLVIAFFAAFPVNKFLLNRHKGHALLHDSHNEPHLEQS